MLDALYIKYGTKLHYLISAVAHYKLENDQDILDFSRSQKLLQEKRNAEHEKLSELPEDVVKQIQAEVKEIGIIHPNAQGMLSIEMFIKLQSIVTKYGIRISNDA